MNIRSIEDEALIEAYERLGSVWKVGDELKVRGQSVHRRLKSAGVEVGNPVTSAEKERIKSHYATDDGLNLRGLARDLGRTPQFVCRVARDLGLTDPNRKKVVGLHGPVSEATKRRQSVAGVAKWKKYPHPKGMLGKTHTAETKIAVAQASKKYWATAKTFEIGLMSPEARERRAILFSARSRSIRRVTRARGGRREDIGDIWFRSSWEANYARYLNLMIRLGVVTSWEYEPETFWFDGIKRGVMSYLPDFKVFYKDDSRPEYVEIKGWVQAKDKVKWKRMAKYHPHIKLVVLKQKEYEAIAKRWRNAIPQWEGSRGRSMPS